MELNEEPPGMGEHPKLVSPELVDMVSRPNQDEGPAEHCGYTHDTHTHTHHTRADTF